MAHEISIRANGIAEMAFVGETPWHALGQRVQPGASIEVWARQAGLDWSAQEAPAAFVRPDGSIGNVADRKVLYRSDSGAALSVVGDGYQVVQPRDVLEFFRDLTEAGDWHIHTAGALRGGRKIWALARNHTEGDVMPGDKVRGNLLLATSLDGSMRTIAGMTAIRVVCANTLRLALSDADGLIATSHRSTFDPSAVKKALGVARESFESFMERARAMAETPIGKEEARETLRRLFGQPTTLARRADVEPIRTSGGTIDGSEFAQLMRRAACIDPPAVEKQREHRSVTRVLELFNGEARGAEHVSSRGTRWGLLNAITEHIDHERGRSADTRLDAAWFGAGHELKTSAAEMLAV